jgi:hypothetical protein
VITGVDSMEILDQAVEVASTFKPLNATAVKKLLGKTRDAAARGEFELFKTTSLFDSTTTNPEWLGEEPERLQAMIPE